jgi:diguanylate cyclase (GGDEF)-like protein/PAS domain S-box-containing protein
VTAPSPGDAPSPPLDLDLHPLRAWRRQVLDAILRGMSALGALAVGGGSVSLLQNAPADQQGRTWLLVAIVWVAYGVLLLVTFLGRLPYTLRAAAVLLLVYAVGLLTLLHYGLSGDGMIFMFTFATLAAVLFGLRGSLAVLALSVVTLSVVATLLTTGQITIPISVQANSAKANAWISTILVFVFLAATVLISMAYLIGRLGWAVARERDARRDERQAQEALRASDARHRGVVDTAWDGIVTMSATGDILSFNSGAERIFGYSAAEVVGHPLTILMPERFRAAHVSGTARYAASGVPRVLGRTLEVAGQRKDGTEFPLELAATEGRDEGGLFFIGIMRDVTERKALEEQLTRQAFHDPLTGLANRALFRERVAHGLDRLARRGETLAVLFLDLDDFKRVNDSLGHIAGDVLLVAVADRLRACVRAGDTVARLGGDEFAILLEDVRDAAAADATAERILAALRAPILLEGKETFVTTSVGIATALTPDEAVDEVLRRADIAMYSAKRRGKGRVEVFATAMDGALRERLALEADLHRAIERGELHLHYQPTVHLTTGRLAGLEALLRWRHPWRGPIAPAVFITLAEETGLILPIGRWVLAHACRQVRAWQERHPAHPALSLAVNLSVR